jgi:hypothetical protein|nr:MAG TPA: hypothetical protein [Caudoviricetes sp.]
MTWGEIQIESLKKMFLNNESLSVNKLSDYMNEKKYKTYLYAMPQACNEAINFIVSKLGSNESTFELEKEDTIYYDLSKKIEDFRMIKGIYSKMPVSWKILNKNTIIIDNWQGEKILVSYEVKPTIINSDTDTNFVIEIASEYANLIPLYIAGELYKDDDLTLSTMYMNEFMTLVDNYANNKYGFPTPMIERIYSMEG